MPCAQSALNTHQRCASIGEDEANSLHTVKMWLQTTESTHVKWGGRWDSHRSGVLSSNKLLISRVARFAKIAHSALRMYTVMYTEPSRFRSGPSLARQTTWPRWHPRHGLSYLAFARFIYPCAQRCFSSRDSFLRAAALMRPRLRGFRAAFGGRPALLRPVESRPSIAAIARSMRSRSVLSSAKIRFISIRSFLRAAILTSTLGFCR